MKAMTQDELDALPDVTPQILPEERMIDGRKVIVPVQTGEFIGALYMGPDDGEYTCQRTGHRYMVGWINGKRVKRMLNVLF